MENIKIIYILPRSKTYCRYAINDGEVHSKRYEDLREFLITLAPSLSTELTEKIHSFSYFILFVEEKKIVDLVNDPQDTIDSIKQTFKNFDPKKIYKFMRSNKKEPLDTIRHTNAIIKKFLKWRDIKAINE